MKPNLSGLIACFEQAKMESWYWIAVYVVTDEQETPEIIINHKDNFDTKLEYYQRAYNNDLELKSYHKIRIVGYECCDDWNYIKLNVRKYC